MRRLFTVRTCILFLIILSVFLIIVKTQFSLKVPKLQSYGFKSLDFSSPSSKEENEDLNYYSQTGNKQNSVNIKNEIKKEGRVDYPFDEVNENNDFDPGGEDSAKNLVIDKNQKYQTINQLSKTTYLNISCDINEGKFIVPCKEFPDDVYVPFNFLKNYYEVWGKLSEDKKSFKILQNPPVKIYKPETRYDPTGVFAFFENYNVEVRERVKCISGIYGVPVSTQWDVNGYFYPIQIAQFGLSHYSKYIVEGEPKRIILENGSWDFDTHSTLEKAEDFDKGTKKVSKFTFSPTRSEEEAGSGAVLNLVSFKIPSRVYVLSFNLKFLTQVPSDFAITVTVQYEEKKYFIHYTLDDFFIKSNNEHIYYGLGKKSLTTWQHVIRDIGIDLQKGIANNAIDKKKKGNKALKSKILLLSLSISPNGKKGSLLPTNTEESLIVLLDNLTLSPQEHLAQFFQSVAWFLEKQDEKGGWGIPVVRKFHSHSSHFTPTLSPGWYSAMGQGHALSLLSRAYTMRKDKTIETALQNAISSIFNEGGGGNKGVRATFLDKFVWYEEYPTTPPSFVLNGFIYSLLGLYDVSKLSLSSSSPKATQLYNEGIYSLKNLLPLFDSGSGSFYDLRHFSLPGIPPNLARLDYHVTHINQLLILNTVEEEEVFRETAERWIKYLEGERAAHN